MWLAYQRIQKYMHLSKGQETVVMGNHNGWSKFPKR